MTDRRLSSIETLQIAAFTVAAAIYVYVIGWVITWVRLAAARIPVEGSLPTVDNAVIFVVGVRLVIAMALVFLAMCAVAYLAHAWTWQRRAQQWHDVVQYSRTQARAGETVPAGDAPAPDAPAPDAPAPDAPAPDASGVPGAATKLSPLKQRMTAAVSTLKPQGPPPDLRAAGIGDPFVRVIAGFNVGVIATAVGLALATAVKPLLDQAFPGAWWTLLVPWALLAVGLGLILARIDPLRGGRLVHGVIWTVVVALALLCSAPLGALLLTWAAIATYGRFYGGRHTQPESKVQFVLSPLPWLLLTVYALVGVAYHGLPPVSFPTARVTAADGQHVGGYLAGVDGAVFLASCTPLADARSINEAVSVIPSSDVKAVAIGPGRFSLDSGLRSSLPTLALHAFGVAASVPTVFKAQLKSTRATCSGEPPPRSSVGYPDPQLGYGVTAGPAPPGGMANDGERPIAAASPGIAHLARAFQPTVLVTVADRFWPVSVGAVLRDVGDNGAVTCLNHGLDNCAEPGPTLDSLSGPGRPSDFLKFPADPALDVDPTGQLDAFLRGQRIDGTPKASRIAVPGENQWLADPGLLNPWASAQVYFYYAGVARPSSWPVSPARRVIADNALIALQYWFFYPYNYYPTAATPRLMNDAPIAGDVVNTDLHQGDWEHVTVLVDPNTGKPQWLYLAHHSDEGQFVRWDSPQLSFDHGHPVVQAALGGHPTYDAHCGERLRFAHGLRGVVSDWVVCGSGRFAFRAATTPLVDITTTKWACWQGHFGFASRTALSPAANEGIARRTIDANVFVAGPRSPLWQAENGHLKADYTRQLTDTGVCANGEPSLNQNAAIQSGLIHHLSAQLPRSG